MSSSIVTFDVASLQFNQELCLFGKTNPSGGMIRIALHRDPDFFDALSVEGNPCYTMIGRHQETNEIVASGNLSYRTVYLNGSKERTCFLSGLRITSRYRSGLLLKRGFKHLQEVYEKQPTALTLTTILEENQLARTVLASGRGSLPLYQELGSYKSLGISPKTYRLIKGSSELQFQRLSVKLFSEWNQFIEECGSRKQFFPVVKAEDLGSGQWRGFAPENLWVAFRNGKIAGTLGLWDQRSLRRWTVHSYSVPLRWLRVPINAVAKLRSIPVLPKAGQFLNCRYLSFVCIEENDSNIFLNLLKQAFQDLINKDPTAFIFAGFHEKDPLLQIIQKRIPFYEMRSKLYSVHWNSSGKRKDPVVGIPYLELGCL